MQSIIFLNYLFSELLQFSLIGFLSILIILFFYFNANIWFNNLLFIENHITTQINKFLLFLCFFIFFISNFLFLYLYLINLFNQINIFIFYDSFFVFNNITLMLNNNFILKFSPDIFGLILNLLAFFVGFISFLTLDTRFLYKNIKFMFFCHCLVFFIFLYTYSNDLLLFFLFYEGLLIPSFFIVYYLSPNRRGIQASLYFLIWTQIGSFLVLIYILYVYITFNIYNFNDLRLCIFNKNETWLLYCLLFFGFGFKVPIWPFHYWLTKTHVEAPTGFSIFLSGFLVKSALYGFYKLSLFLGTDVNTTLFSTIAFLGIIDSSLKMWGQTDLKKLVAYGTVQEMNIIYLTFCWGDSYAIYGGFLFCLTHAFLSSLFFYYVDCIYRRFKSRSLVEVQGLLHLTPNLGIVIFIGCILYAGLPGTLKFLCEYYIFSGLIEASPISTLLLIYIANFIGLIGFSKCWFNAIFGINIILQKHIIIDLTWRELFIINYCFFLLIILNSFTIWLI